VASLLVREVTKGKQMKLLLQTASIAIFCLALLACSSVKTSEDKKTNKKSAMEQNQTQVYAERRAKAVNSVNYSLQVTMDNESLEYSGQEQMSFNLTEVMPDLHLDFRGGTVLTLSINGQNVTDIQHTQGRLFLPKQYLQVGANKVALSYKQKYSNDGRGLYRFKDPEDGKVYFWTQFESFDANHFFPCFDQPDLKATLRLTVTSPKEWEVITTTLEEKTANQGAQKVREFAVTPLMSTYLFSLHAGPYKVWKSQAGDIPLRLFARQTLAKYVKPEVWFTLTKQGFNFFNTYFDYKYPFKKYDQIISPDRGGAMENIAAVTFSEWFVKRGKETKEETQVLANVLLHEMAHMWFGDLVTMKWWNGLWLNESFATYMADVALHNATEFKESWISFQNWSKGSAYVQDQLVTTHSINGEIPDIESTFTNFDAITYGKGASVMKQLAFYIGENNFRDGVRNYFKKYQYQNTTLQDFIGSLEQASKKNLQSWALNWLEKKGLDTVTVNYQCSGSKITSASLQMTPAVEEPAQRIHATKIGLFDIKNGKPTLRKTVAMEYSNGSTEVKALQGEKCPDFIYPNVDDHDYVKVQLDPRSLDAAKNYLSQFSDPLLRQMVWNNLYEMVRDNKLRISDFSTLLMKHLPKESNQQIVDNVTRRLGNVAYYMPKKTPEQQQRRTQVIAEMEQMCLNQIQRARAGSDLQKIWWDTFANIVETPQGLAKLSEMLNGKSMTLDQDRRWKAINRLNAFATADSLALLTAEKAKDPTENGIKAAMGAEAARPEADRKFKLLQTVAEPKADLSLARRSSIARSAFPINQDQFREMYSKDFYNTLLKLQNEGRDSQFLRMYTSLTPTTCSENSLKQIDSFIQRNESSLVPSVLKPLKVSRQEEARCIAIREAALSK